MSGSGEEKPNHSKNCEDNLRLGKSSKESNETRKHSLTLAKYLFGDDELNATEGLAKNENTKNDVCKLTPARGRQRSRKIPKNRYRQRSEPLEKLKVYDQNQLLKKVRYLPEEAKQELEQVASLYSEYATFFDWNDEQLNFLFLIEYFMRFTQYNHIGNFIDSNISLLDVIENSSDKYLSHLDKLFLIIHQMINQDNSIHDEIQEDSWVGWRVKAFFRFYTRTCETYSNLLGNFEDDLVDFKQSDYLQSLYKQEKKESLKASKNSLEAKKYLRTMIKADVFALCFEFSYVKTRRSTAEQGVEAFHLILTDFLKNLKRTQKLSTAKLVAYLGTRFFQDDQLYADVTFIFDAKSLLSNDDEKNEVTIQNVKNNITDYWENYCKIKQEKIKEHDDKQSTDPAEKVRRSQLRDAIQVIDRLEIQALKVNFPQPIKYHDKKDLRAFMDETISFYTAHALLCNWKPALEDLVDPKNKENSNLSNMEQFLKGRIIAPQKKSSKKVKSDQNVEAIEDLSCTDHADSIALADPHQEPQSQKFITEQNFQIAEDIANSDNEDSSTRASLKVAQNQIKLRRKTSGYRTKYKVE